MDARLIFDYVEAVSDAVKKDMQTNMVLCFLAEKAERSLLGKDAIKTAMDALKCENSEELGKLIENHRRLFESKWPEGSQALDDLMPIVTYLTAIRKVYIERISNLLKLNDC